MSWGELAPVLSGAIVATGGLLVVRFARHRHGRWEALKDDLELASNLDDRDPMKEWMLNYVDVRLRAYAASEVRRSRRSFGKYLTLASYSLAGVIVTVFLTMKAYRAFEDEDSWIGAGWATLALVAFSLTAAAVYFEEIDDVDRYILRGVRTDARKWAASQLAELYVHLDNGAGEVSFEEISSRRRAQSPHRVRLKPSGNPRLYRPRNPRG
ncbi:hypothetical protein [Williamsia muralis]|uniref:hypothetical protein n=1 Tax=Williamsia marianensis TaxID=85044 RepID=UPI000DE7B564|nr:hypothetical protein [Williamsia marianensis]PVY32286.1 hypothetical protein C7458_10229 [Williamsia marianensis]